MNHSPKNIIRLLLIIVSVASGFFAYGYQDITIEGTRESHGGSFDKTTVRHGLMGASGSGIGFSVGERFIQKTTIDTIGNNIGSLVASAGGDVIFSAGNNYAQRGSDVHAYTGDIFIKGADVQIVSSQDESYHYERNYRRQTGVTFQIGHPAIAAYNTINRLSDSLKDVKEHKSRLNAVAAGAAALSLRNNYDSYKRDMGVTNVEGIAQSFANQPFKSGASGFNISVSGGTQRQQSTSTSTESSHIGSSVSAGRNVYIESTDRDILVEGSLIKAGNNVTLNAARDLVVLAGTDKSQTTADRSSSGFSIGGSVAVGSGGLKFGITVSGNAGRGSGNYDHTNYQNSYITAGNQLGIVTGRDAVIMGGVLSGDKIYADIGRDLLVRSMQDVERDKSTDYSGGASVSWGGGWSASANVDYQNIEGDYLSVQEQSGLFAGDQGFDITVKGHTELIGAAITSSQKAVEEGLNQLTTGTLNLTDLENHAKYEGEGISLGGGYGNGKWGVNPPINLSAGKDTKSTTESGISGGLITITDPERQQALLDEKANQLAIDKAAEGIDKEGIDKEGIDKEGMGTDHLVIEGLSKLQLHNKPSLGKDEEIDEPPKPPTVEEYLASINRNVLTGVDQSNALERVYDESSIKASMEIAKIFRDETNTFAANRARETDEAKATIDAYNKASEEDKAKLQSAYDQAVQTVADNKIWEPGGNGRLIMTAISLAVGGNATGSMSDLIRDAGVNVLQSLITSEIKKLADSLENEGLRAILHTIVGCAGAAAKEGDCASGALAAGASSVIGSILKSMNTTNIADLSEEEKNNRVNLITSLISAITAAAGGDSAMAGAAAQIEMENNQWGTNANVDANREMADRLLKDPNLDPTLRNKVQYCADTGGDPKACRGIKGMHDSALIEGMKKGDKYWQTTLEIINPADPVAIAGGFIIGKVFKIVTKVAKKGGGFNLVTKEFDLTTNAGRKGFSESVSMSEKQLQKKYKHAGDFGVTGNFNKGNAQSFGNAVRNHVADVDTYQYGTYISERGSSVFYNPNTHNVVIIGKDGNFISGWRLVPGDPQYIKYMADGGLR